MHDRTFIFGRTPCNVTIRPTGQTVGGGTAWIATVTTRGDCVGRTRFRAATRQEALALAALYLERCLGPLSEAPPPR